MRVQRVLLIGVCVLLAAAAVFAGSKPMAVSPGDASKLVLIGDTCPTFSWGQVDGARSYELVVYRLGDDDEEAQPVVRQRISGSALAWTPSLSRCLERGGRYAWSVRAVGGEEASEWSAPSLFQVAAGASQAEFEAALQVVRGYLGDQRAEGSEDGASVEAESASESGRASLAPSPESLGAAATQLSVDGGVVATSFTGDGSTLTDLDPALFQAGTAGIDITGTAANVTGVVAVDHGGTGATTAELARDNLGVVAGAHTVSPTMLPPTGPAGGDLTGNYPAPAVAVDAITGAEILNNSIAEADLAFDPATQSEVGDLQASIDALQDRFDCPGAAFSSGGRFVDCGNGTIRDMNTGKIWLKDASCAALPGTGAAGRASWTDAIAAAAALKDGICGLTDGSLPGQWRLPEIGEFCSRDAPTPVGGSCPHTDSTDSMVNTNFSQPTLSNAAGVANWATDGDAFVGVQSGDYWSATEDGPTLAWSASLIFGDVANGLTDAIYYVWPVRSGQ